MKFAALLGVLLGAPAFATTEKVEPIRVTVSPRVGLAPSDLHLKIIIERDVRNKALVIVVDGDHFRYDSARAIEGDQAHRVWDIWLQSLPCGDYSIAVAVVRDTDAPKAHDRLQLRGAQCPELDEAEP